MPVPYLALTVAVFIAITLCICVLYIRDLPEFKAEIKRKDGERSTFFVDVNEIDERCDICFGELEGTISECVCGKVFHDSCIGLTGECPYCGSRDGMITRDIRRPDCPLCGSKMDSDICTCGAVLPRKDGSFRCTCGNTMHMDMNRCPRCGATFTPIRKDIN